MKRLWTPFILLMFLGPVTRAQSIDLTPLNTYGYDDGTGEVAWKINNPSGSSDWFSVDFGADASGATMAGLWVDMATIGPVGGSGQIGFTGTAANGFPDIGSATLQNVQISVTDGFNSPTAYATPCADPGSDFHVLYQQAPGDSETWMVADTDGPVLGRSFFSSNSYVSGTAAPMNWRLGYAGWDFPLDGTLLINGGTDVTVSQVDEVCVTFTACAPGVASSFYLCSPLFFGPLLPAVLSVTGGLLGGPCSNQWTICTTLTCRDQAGGPYGFCCIYLDPCDTKPNGKPKAKVSSTAMLTITCSGTCASCYGQLDDGIVDFYIWRIQNPAGTGDWFNVNHGSPQVCDAVSMLTGVELSSWDFCGTGPCWAEVGVYPDDGSGAPDLTMGATAANPCMAAGSADGGPYPMTYYDIADVPAGSASWHVGARWGTGDTCIWIGSDTDGTDSSCGLVIPNAGTSSGFTRQSYTTGVTGFTAGNWCMKIDWT